MPPVTATSRSDPRHRRKPVLFCPACWHESPVDGDWHVQVTQAGEQIDCPVCSATVTVRPEMQEDATASTDAVTDSPPLTPFVRAVVAVTHGLASYPLVWFRRHCIPGATPKREDAPDAPSSGRHSSRCQP